MVKTKTQTTNTFDIPRRFIERPKLREAEIQTEPEPPSPKPTIILVNDQGVDACTQLDEGTFFDFEEEVLPVVEIMVSRILKVSLIEVEEEAYMGRIKSLKDSLEAKRNKEVEDVRQIERMESRKHDERKDRNDQENVVLAISKSALAKTKAITFTKSMFKDLAAESVSSLAHDGAFRSSLLVHLLEAYVPSLLHEAEDKLKERLIIQKIDAEYRKLRFDYVPELLLEAQRTMRND